MNVGMEEGLGVIANRTWAGGWKEAGRHRRHGGPGSVTSTKLVCLASRTVTTACTSSISFCFSSSSNCMYHLARRVLPALFWMRMKRIWGQQEKEVREAGREGQRYIHPTAPPVTTRETGPHLPAACLPQGPIPAPASPCGEISLPQSS